MLDECLAQYRKGRVGSVSTHSVKTMVGWHYKLFREAEGENTIKSSDYAFFNLLSGFIRRNIMWKVHIGNMEE